MFHRLCGRKQILIRLFVNIWNDSTVSQPYQCFGSSHSNILERFRFCRFVPTAMWLNYVTLTFRIELTFNVTQTSKSFQIQIIISICNKFYSILYYKCFKMSYKNSLTSDQNIVPNCAIVPNIDRQSYIATPPLVRYFVDHDDRLAR